MDFAEWEPVYEEILADMGYDRSDDEASVRVLKAVTLNSDLISGDEAAETMADRVTVIGNAPCLEDDIKRKGA
ncbi:MAG: DNA transporter, partial [Candidatus Methanomethylophilaceae archaeon]|nr:DNA transporter [Candidatus Methanomethylophilaceae archaeon]